MADGNHTVPNWWRERICENGAYFCKRDRNKAGTIGIYTCKGRQTIRVGSTDIGAAEEIIEEGKRADIALALARFVLSDAEAAARERDGVRKVDMSVREVLNLYTLARDAFHETVIGKLEARYAAALAENDLELAATLPFQLKQARRSKLNEHSLLAAVTGLVEETWKASAPPKVSELSNANQLLFVNTCRTTGYAEGTIRNYLTRLFSAINHCDRDQRLLYAPPSCIRYETWSITTDEDEDVVVYEIEELAKLFNAAAERESWWKYMNLATSGARPMTLIEATWMQITKDPPRWNLNPPGKRRTRKRRPTIPLCRTLAAEVESWSHDAARIISDGHGKQMEDPGMFTRIQRVAGVKRGTPMTMRKTIRTWLMVNGVPEAIADLFVGHADEGSATGRKFYKAKLPQYMEQAAAAIEKLYDALRPLVGRPFAGGSQAVIEDQPSPDADWVGALRGECVTEMRVSG